MNGRLTGVEGGRKDECGRTQVDMQLVVDLASAVCVTPLEVRLKVLGYEV